MEQGTLESISIERLVEILPKTSPECSRKAIGQWRVSPEYFEHCGGLLGAKAKVLEVFCTERLGISPFAICCLRWNIFDDVGKTVQADFAESYTGFHKGRYVFNIELWV